MAPEEDKARNPVTEEQLQAYQGEFCEKLQSQGENRLKAVLKPAVLRLNGEEISLCFDNHTQEEVFLQELKRDFLFFMREQSQNYSLVLYEVVQEGTQEKKPYHPGEKQAYLYKSNPQLKLLEETLGLKRKE